MTRWLLLAFRKQNLLITAHIPLLLNNNFLFFFPSCHSSSSRLFFSLRVCLAVRLLLWTPVWVGSILLSSIVYLIFSVEPTYFTQFPQTFFVLTIQEKTKQVLSTQIVLSLVPVLPHSLTLWFICMRDRREYLTVTAGQWTGSLLCVSERVVFVIVCVRQRDEEGAVGWWGENASGSTVSLAETTRNRQRGFVHKLVCECKTSCPHWINYELIDSFPDIL